MRLGGQIIHGSVLIWNVKEGSGSCDMKAKKELTRYRRNSRSKVTEIGASMALSRNWKKLILGQGERGGAQCEVANAIGGETLCDLTGYVKNYSVFVFTFVFLSQEHWDTLEIFFL